MNNFEYKKIKLIEDIVGYTYPEELFIEILLDRKTPFYLRINRLPQLVKAARKYTIKGTEYQFAPAYRKDDLEEKKSDKQNIRSSHCFWLDIKTSDVTMPIVKQHYEMEKILDKFQNSLLKYKITPTFVLSNGFVFHVFFIFETHYLAPFTVFKKIQKTLTKISPGIFAADISGFIHLPDTINYQIKENPQEVKLIGDYRNLYTDEENGFIGFKHQDFQGILERFG